MFMNQVLEKVGVEQPTYDNIFDEYVWESEQISTVKDHLLLFVPRLLLYPNIFRDYIIFV